MLEDLIRVQFICLLQNMLGKPGDGFKIAMGAFDGTRPLVSEAHR